MTWAPLYTDDAWAHRYEAIRADLGIDRAADERAASLLASYLARAPLGRLDVEGDAVAIAVGAALDTTAIRGLQGVDTVVATADALERLCRAGVPVRLVVTDLDSDPAAVTRRTRAGDLVAVHAHGDNVPALRRWVPRMATENVVGTTQADPTGPLVNTGGFTDGDRAAFLAHALGAASLSFAGWDLEDPDVGATKRLKLTWARRLLTDLERHRGESYAILD